MFRDDFLCAKFFDQWTALSRQSQVLRQDLYEINANMMGAKEWEHDLDRRKHEINIAWAEHKANRLLQ